MSPAPANIRRAGFAAVIGTFLFDQATKLWLLNLVQLEDTGPWTLAPFFDFIAVWNRGISYGLFQQYSDLGRWLLIAASVAASIWLATLLWRARDRMGAVALGLIIGGALGNALDRAIYGAVFDFAHFHVGNWSWYVFNVADIAIVVGVAALLYESVFPGRGKELELPG